MVYIPLTAGQVDTDSPIDEVLMDTIRTNMDDLDSRAVDNGNAHDHVGGDGASIQGLATDISKPYFFDDFLGAFITSDGGVVSSHAWSMTAANTVTVVENEADGKIETEGDINNTFYAATTGDITESGNSITVGQYILDGDTLTFEARVKGVTNHRLVVGLTDEDNAPLTAGDGVFWGRNDGTNLLRAFTVNGGTSTTTDASVDLSTSVYQRLKIIATNTSVTFYINDALEATHTTDIPTARMTIALGVIANGTTKNARFDYVQVQKNARQA